MTKAVWVVVPLCLAAAIVTRTGSESGEVRNPSPGVGSIGYLEKVMDQFHAAFDVYTDGGAAGNHFLMRARMSSPADEEAVPPMDETFTDRPHSGITSIKATFKAKGSNWGGWYFMNGVLQGAETEPRENWGDQPRAGVDLRGATRLTFWARGEQGGERVEFFALGIGRHPDTGRPLQAYPDSSPKVSTGYVTLSRDWREYTVNLTGKELQYVLGGFGWVTNAAQNRNRDITLYIDDIRYDRGTLSEPHFLVSYATERSGHDFDVIMRNVAFTYDNAVTLLALLASGKTDRAKLLADALVYAQTHDRFYTDGRLRNAYQGGDLALPPGWKPQGKEGTVRLPGWYDAVQRRWLEDKAQVSTHTGNVAWAMLALLAYHGKAGGTKYRAAAERMGEWIEANCRDTRGAGGYTAGYEGWEPLPAKLLYKSTEHNIDVFAAFERLYHVTKDRRWRDRAEHAKRFVLGMWDPTDGKFWTGTGNDGMTINTSVVPVDVQAWAVLALREEGKPYWRALDYAEKHLSAGQGFDFNQDRDGVWYEGTAQMAVAYRHTGRQVESQALVTFLQSAQFESGALPAASKDGLTTGFHLPDGQPWLCFRRAHVAATAWLALAEMGANPFWM